jgi:exonuclease III
LFGAHLHDPRSVPNIADRGQWAIDLAETIDLVETVLKCHDRTVLIGDLNMNPYDEGLTGGRTLHAVMTKELARKVHTWSGRERRKCFYNPMWSYFGDRSQGPPGTHYYRDAKALTNTFWHMYDQVLVRPSIMDFLVRVEILSEDGENDFMTSRGVPRHSVLSDHLPLLVEFDFTRTT